jgi:poly(3-hydroxybutyrate) depolymerase
LKHARCTALAFFLLVLALSAQAKPKLDKLSFVFEGKTRNYYTFVPDKAGPLPVLLLLHGSGRNGEIMATPWKDLAAKEGIILVAPDAFNSDGWNFQMDPPRFMHAVVERVKTQHAVDDSRIYLFGHSAGAVMALIFAVVDSHYYASVALHAGALNKQQYDVFPYSERRTPIFIQVGDQDAGFPVAMVLETKKQFEANGFEIKLTIIPHHDHNYYGISDAVNAKAWEFLKASTLPTPYVAAETDNQ